MKFGKFLFCIILILSLSALDLNLLNNFNVNASTRFENTLLNLENNTNNYINLSDEDYVQVFKENNQLQLRCSEQRFFQLCPLKFYQ